MFIITLQVFILLPIAIYFVLSFLWIISPKMESKQNYEKPFVSVLVAARDEEKNIATCLKHLLAQEYVDYEVLVGNDSSQDKTAAIAGQLATKDNRIKVHDIKSGGEIKGKANVLAQLADFANGEVLFFTDADVKVPQNWIAAMLKGFDDKIGMVIGITGVEGQNAWAKFQHLDWLIAIGMIKVVSDLGSSATAMGNNMAISRKAYDAVGGFGGIPFSVTEDFEILRHITARGFSAKGIIAPDVYALTVPAKNIMELLHQRKRWMKGALRLPLILVFLLMTQALFFPLLIVLLVISPVPALFLWGGKVLIQGFFASLVSARVGKKEPFVLLVLYEIYASSLSLMMLLFYILPIEVKWKGRKY